MDGQEQLSPEERLDKFEAAVMNQQEPVQMTKMMDSVMKMDVVMMKMMKVVDSARIA